MGDRIAILRDGVLEQVGTPREVHDRPATSFVAGFIGSPPTNLLPGELLGEPGITLGIRPEDLFLAVDGPIEAQVSLVESLGHEHHVACRAGGEDGTLLIVRLPASASPPEVGERVRLAVRGTIHRFAPATGARVEP